MLRIIVHIYIHIFHLYIMHQVLDSSDYMLIIDHCLLWCTVADINVKCAGLEGHIQYKMTENSYITLH